MDERKENSIKYQKLNDEDDDVVKIKSPEDDASIFSLLTFSYSWFYFLNFSFVDFYIWKGLFTSPKAEDVPELSQEDKCEVQVKNFGKNWKNQPKEKKSLIKTLFETNILRIFESIFHISFKFSWRKRNSSNRSWISIFNFYSFLFKVDSWLSILFVNEKISKF